MSKMPADEKFDLMLHLLFFGMVLWAVWWYVFRLAPAWSRAVDCHYQVGTCETPSKPKERSDG